MKKQKIRHVKISKNKTALIFDKRRLPVENDTLTIGDVTAIFIKRKTA